MLTHHKTYLLFILLTMAITGAFAQQKEASTFHGFEMLDSSLNGIVYKVVFPQTANENKDWIWRARFWGHEPQTDSTLLAKGFHLAYIEIGGLFGNEESIKIWDDCQELTNKEIAEQLHLSPRTVESYRKNMLEKIGARNSVGLVFYALKHGVVELGE